MYSRKLVPGLLCAWTLILAGCSQETAVPAASSESQHAAAGAQSGELGYPATSTASGNDVAPVAYQASNPSSDPSGAPIAPPPYPEGAQQALQAPVSDKILAAETAALMEELEADRSGPAYDTDTPAPSRPTDQGSNIDPETGRY